MVVTCRFSNVFKIAMARAAPSVGSVPAQSSSKSTSVLASASEILKKMEKAGLIIRVPNEMNRRASDIVLTRQGRSVSEKLIEQRRGRYREMMACLSEDEKESLFSMLDRMKEDWQQRFRAVPESAIASGDSSLQKERNKISETSSDGK